MQHSLLVKVGGEGVRDDDVGELEENHGWLVGISKKGRRMETLARKEFFGEVVEENYTPEIPPREPIMLRRVGRHSFFDQELAEGFRPVEGTPEERTERIVGEKRSWEWLRQWGLETQMSTNERTLNSEQERMSGLNGVLE